jgi:site-specific recombinase XerD
MPYVKALPSGRFRVQWRDAAGRKRSAGRSFPTETMARTYGLDREAEVRAGTDRDPNAGRILLKDWITEWSQGRVAEPRTLAKIKGHLDKYVLADVGGVGALGDMRIEQVDEMALQAWVKRLQAQQLAPSTVTGIYVSLASVLRGAVRLRRLVHDPTSNVSLPTIPPPDDFYWERTEIDALREPMVDPQDLALFELLIGTGVRWGEAVGLHLPRWQPLRRRLSVVEVISEAKGFALKQYPKGKRRRELPAVAPELLEAMAAHLAVNPPIDCGLSHGRGKRCPGLVFHVDGRPMSRHDWPRNVLDPAIVAAGVRRGTPHDLRHTYASWLVIDGVPLRVVQELLGHASIRTTERYSHLAPTTLDDPRLIASLMGRTAQNREAEREAGA